MTLLLWKHQRTDVYHCFKRQVWKCTSLETSKNISTLLFQETSMEIYKFGNTEEQIYIRLDGDKFAKVQLWKQWITEIHKL